MKRISSIQTASETVSSVVSVTSSKYHLTTESNIILVDTTQAVTIYVGEDVTTVNSMYVIKDATGNAFDYPITISASGVALIDGQKSVQIVSSYSSFTIYCDGTNWFII